MKLFLLRHAAADFGGPDPDRPLSESGRSYARQLAEYIASNSYFSFSEIWCSPYKRARQTAEPLLSSHKRIQLKDFLVPEANPASLISQLSSREDALLVVGHNPHLSLVAKQLLGLHRNQVPPSFKKGALFVFKKHPDSPSGFSLSACLPPVILGLTKRSYKER